MTRIAVVGTGTMAALHVEEWLHVKGCEVVALVGRTEQHLSNLAAKYHVKGFFDLEEALRQVEIDVVDICVPTHLHEEVVGIACMAKKAIICEKPLAISSALAKKMVEQCAEYQVPLYVGHVLRFSPEYVEAREQVLSGAIGKPGIMRLSRKGPYPKGRDDWYKDEAKSGGVVLDLAIHDIDWLRWTFGEVERVMAKQIKRENLDYALITLRFQSGVICHLDVSWGAKSFVSSFELAGSNGMITYQSNDHVPIVIEMFNEEKEDQERVAVPSYIVRDTPLKKQLQHFMDCIENNESPIVTAMDAVSAIYVAECIIESMKSGKPVEFYKGGILN
ncbi:Gfo/Idh/MocA family protein [Peribacillus huizhouensis]|uniref:Dehydrogenase n=1 Tax=Peribacillus huizhouensis TaxID=1501239 RepID=A0ABR6CNT2_9BACI|nr:Gfo/Idh/MocA family oxidoreductase [Peribacillus huizhouensis]MBA9026665.1 putative dehydrogenase [Peribacillus huizhouensis]